MGNYTSQNKNINPFIMIDNDNTGRNSRFACDISFDPDQTNIKNNSNQKVKDTNLASLMKTMIIDYDGTYECIPDSSKTYCTNTNKNYIESPGNGLPGGKYLDLNGNLIKPYLYKACSKGL